MKKLQPATVRRRKAVLDSQAREACRLYTHQCAEQRAELTRLQERCSHVHVARAHGKAVGTNQPVQKCRDCGVIFIKTLEMGKSNG